MSNESNRDAREIRPSELQASDFFPPGCGWNKDEGEQTGNPQGMTGLDDQESDSVPRPRSN